MLAAEAMSAEGHVTQRKNVLHQPAVWSSISSRREWESLFFELSSQAFFLLDTFAREEKITSFHRSSLASK